MPIINGGGFLGWVGGSDSGGEGGGTVDVINNLTSTAIDKALSANMGRELNQLLGTHSTTIASETVLGHVKIDGATIKITADGTIFADVSGSDLIQSSWKSVLPTTSVGQNEWEITLATLDVDNDTIFVVYNTTLLSDDMYTITNVNGKYILKVNNVPSDIPIANNHMYVVVLQNTVSNGVSAISGSLLIDGTIPEEKLDSALREKIDTNTIVLGIRNSVTNAEQNDVFCLPFNFELVRVDVTVITPSSTDAFVNIRKTSDFTVWSDLFDNISLPANTHHISFTPSSQVLMAKGEFIRLFTDSFTGASALSVNAIVKII